MDCYVNVDGSMTRCTCVHKFTVYKPQYYSAVLNLINGRTGRVSRDIHISIVTPWYNPRHATFVCYLLYIRSADEAPILAKIYSKLNSLTRRYLSNLAVRIHIITLNKISCLQKWICYKRVFRLWIQLGFYTYKSD